MKITGLEELQGQLEELGDELTQRKKLRSAARKAFAPVLEAARGKAPVDTGLLRDSIVIASALPKSGESVVAVGLTVVGKTSIREGSAPPSVRWRFAEQGTRYQPARPFLRPALDSKAEEVVSGFTDELKKAIDKVVRKKGRGR